jgi:hypothetical protein
MAVTLTDHRTIRNEADSNTGWTGNTNVFTADPDPVETTGCLGQAVSIATADGYHTATATSLSSRLVYVWVLLNGTMDSLVNGGCGIYVSDGTNSMSYHLAGSDAAGFRHGTGPVGWQCLVLDQASLPTNKTTRGGTEGSLDWASITRVGATFKTLSKALGGASNCFIDIIRVLDLTLNDGCALSVAGGTSGAPGTWSDIATTDRSSANQAAHGLVRELGAGVYGVQGPLRFGNATGTASSWFEDSNVTVTFEARGLRTTVYRIVLTDNGTGTTTFIMRGSTIVAASGVGAAWDSGTDTDVTDVTLTNCLLSGLTGGIKVGGSQVFTDCSVTGSGAITLTGAADLRRTTVAETTVAADASALVWNLATDPSGYLDDMEFTKGTTATHAIEFGLSSPTTINLLGQSFSGYNASNGQTDSTLYFARTTGTVTVNLSGVSGTVSYKSAGATISLVNSTTLTLTGLKNPTEVRVYDAGTTTAVAGQEDVTTGTFSTGIDAATYPDVDIAIVSLGYQNLRLLNVDVTSDTTIPIQQVIDRQYFNPT